MFGPETFSIAVVRLGGGEKEHDTNVTLCFRETQPILVNGDASASAVDG